MKSGTAKGTRSHPRSDIPVSPSGGNVFEDLGLPDSAELLVKSGMAARISAIMDERSLTQVATARLLGIHQADVSDLVRGKLKGFSTDRLLRFLTALGQDVEIRLPGTHHTHRPGTLRMVKGTGAGVGKLAPRKREVRPRRETT